MNNKKISKKILFSLIFMSFGLQGCLEDASVSEIESASVDGGIECVKDSLSINGPSINKADSDSSFSLDADPCRDSHSVFWDSSNGVTFRSDSIDHSYKNAGEYALKVNSINSDGSVESALKHIIVASCEAGEVCKSISSPQLAHVGESVNIDLVNVDSQDSISSEIKVTDPSGNESILDGKSFQAQVQGKHIISISSDGVSFSRDLMVTDISLTSNSSVCNLKDSIISGASKLKLNEESLISIDLPSCLSSRISAFKFSISDGRSDVVARSTIISFSEAGNYSYSAEISIDGSEEAIVISRSVSVEDEVCTDCAIIAREEYNDPARDPASGGDDTPFGGGPIIPVPPTDQACGDVPHGGSVTLDDGIVSSEIVSCESDLGNKIVVSISKETRVCNNGVYENGENTSPLFLRESACYKWIVTDTTTCSAACGGSQSDIHSCLDSSGAESSSVGDTLCGAPVQAESRVCDGDPNFEEVKITETLEKGEKTVCNSNKTGYVIDKEVTREVFRCVDHVITSVDSVTTHEDAPFCMDLKRCSNDSLSPSRAHGRLNWMKSCAADQAKIQDFFDLTANFDRAPQNSYTISEDGATIIGRPTYVTFRDKEGQVWKAPAPGTKNWRTRSTKYSVVDSPLSCEIPNDANIAGICLSSCVTPSQMITSGNGHALPISSAYANRMSDLQTLAPFSSILKPILISSPVMQFITEIDDSEHNIMIFTMASGKTIEYTPNHPVLTADGKLKEAENFIVGQSFVRKSGTLDEIVKIKNIKYFGKVYNVYMKDTTPERNVVVINDYLTGSAYFQDEGHDHVDRQILRDKLTK